MLTLNDIKSKLHLGMSVDAIHVDFIASVNREYYDKASTSKEKFNLKKFKAGMLEHGVDIDAITPVDCGHYKRLMIPLENLTFRLTLDNRGINYSSFRFLPEKGAWDRSLSMMGTETLIAAMFEADRNYPMVKETWASYELVCHKFWKVREIRELSYPEFIKDKFKGTGIMYNIDMKPTKIILKVKLARCRYFEVQIPPEEFPKIVNDSFVEDVISLSKILDKKRYPCSVGRYENTMTWQSAE